MGPMLQEACDPLWELSTQHKQRRAGNPGRNLLLHLNHSTSLKYMSP